MAPGCYLSDRTEGITAVEDLPAPQTVFCSRNYRRRACPRCGHGGYRDNLGYRLLHDVGDPRTERPRDIEVLYSRHHCIRCQSYFSTDLSDLAPPGSHYTHRVI